MVTERFSPAIGDTDGLRHINNLAIQYWMEKARNPIFMICNPTLSFEKWNQIMVRSEVDFLHQAYFGKECEIHTGISKLGTKSMNIYQELYQDGHLCARSTVITVFFDFELQQSIEIPKEIRPKLEKLLIKN